MSVKKKHSFWHNHKGCILLGVSVLGCLLVMGPIPQPNIVCDKLTNVVEAYFNGDITIGDAVGDILNLKAGTHNYENATTINYDGATTLDATGQSVEIIGSWGMGDDQHFLRDVDAGLTASTTQSQGQGALTAEVNEVATCANNNDTVTLPSAVTGMRVSIVNNGAKTLQIFPASGDDLGAGVDTSTTLASGSNTLYQAYDVTNWEGLF